MDTDRLDKLLRGTLDPVLREQAELELEKIKKIIGFCPALLQLVMDEYKDMAVRQAGVIYLKNMVTQYWKDADSEEGEDIPFHIHEQDRELIRASIIDAMVHAPEVVGVQLARCIYHIARLDFPGRWPTIAEKINHYLQEADGRKWLGAYTALYQLVKTYEYKKKEARGPMNECMGYLLPVMHHQMVQLLPDSSENSVLIQKICLKIIFAYTQFSLSLELFTQPVFTQWMEILREIANREVPEELNQRDEEERVEMPWWKVKKWAFHIICRIFDRYGSPSAIGKEYKKFAEWFIETFSKGFLEVVLKTLEDYHLKKFVSPRVLQQCLSYVELSVCQSFTWKLLKPHAIVIIENVVFSLMCHSDYDDDLWQSDPAEYVRVKSDVYEDLVSPVTAGQGLLINMVKKRKEMLEKTMAFVMKVLNTPNLEPQLKDGIFHMIGTIAPVLIKKKGYKDKMENMVAHYVFPELISQHGYLRSRGCWLLQVLEDMKYESAGTLETACQHLLQCLLNEPELPVRVESALAMCALLESQDKAEALFEPNVTAIVDQLMKVIKETENDEVTNVLCKFVAVYSEKLIPIAGNMCIELASTFQKVVQSEEGADENTITAMGLLSAIETLLNCMEDQKDAVIKIEPVALQVVGLILTKRIIEYYEEAFSLLCTLTTHHISNEAWQCYEFIYAVFKDDGNDYFTEMMPALHNYVTVDTPRFLENEARLKALLDMCRVMLMMDGDSAEDEQCHAAKLLECVVLQCKEVIGQFLPQLMTLIVSRLTGKIRTTELRTMLLQNIIAAIYVTPEQTLSILEGIPMSNTGIPVLHFFIEQWLKDVDSFFGLHDRKICILGLCTLMQLGPGRLPVLADLRTQLLPSLVLLFQGLKKAYKLKALEDKEEEDSDDDEDDYESDAENDVLSSDEDEVNETTDNLIECIDSTDDDYEDDDEGNVLLEEELSETTLESYTTPIDKEECGIDEYWVFKSLMQGLEQSVPTWYNALTEVLNEDQKKEMIDVSTLADQRRAAQQSKKIEESGGYNFEQQTVPSSFNFGAFNS